MSGLNFHRITRGQNQVDLTNVPAPSTQDFTHVVVSCDGSTMTLFVNGLAVKDSPITGGAGTTRSPFTWGAPSIGDALFVGALDELAVYGRELSARRVEAHYRAGRPLPR